MSRHAEEIAKTRQRLRGLSNDEEIMGLFHYDFETEQNTWEKVLKKSTGEKQIMIISPDVYGQSGEVMKSLPLDVKLTDLKEALLTAHKKFMEVTQKKNYRAHVQKGEEKGIIRKLPGPSLIPC